MLDKKVGPEMRAKMITGRLNPDWVEWLMGYPIGWTDIRTRWEPMKQYDIGIEPVDDVPRLTPYQSNRTKRLKALGNAVVPQCVEIIARLLLDKSQKA